LNDIKKYGGDILENTGIENAILDDKGIPITGLSDSEAEVLFESGLSNKNETKVGKSYLKIVADNVFTFFNMIWAIVAAVLIAVGSYSNLTFLIVVVPNTVIALIQEIRAKQTVEKLSVTTDPIATVIRSGEKKENIARYAIDFIAQTIKLMAKDLIGEYGNLPMVFAGGVMSDKIIKNELQNEFRCVFASAEYSCDNAVGIAVLTAIKEGYLI